MEKGTTTGPTQSLSLGTGGCSRTRNRYCDGCHLGLRNLELRRLLELGSRRKRSLRALVGVDCGATSDDTFHSKRLGTKSKRLCGVHVFLVGLVCDFFNPIRRTGQYLCTCLYRRRPLGSVDHMDGTHGGARATAYVQGKESVSQKPMVLHALQGGSVFSLGGLLCGFDGFSGTIADLYSGTECVDRFMGF